MGVNDVAVDAVGNIYVVDFTASRVQVFDPSGTYLAGWGSPAGNGTYQLNEPSCVVVGDDGFAYVCDYGNNRILKYRVELPS